MSRVAAGIRRVADWWEAAAEKWQSRRYRVVSPTAALGERAADVRDKTVEAAKRVGKSIHDHGREALGESRPVSIPWVALVVIGVATFAAGYGIAKVTEGDPMSREDRALLHQIAGYSAIDRTQQATYGPNPMKPVDMATRPVVEPTKPAPATPLVPRRTGLRKEPG